MNTMYVEIRQGSDSMPIETAIKHVVQESHPGARLVSFTLTNISSGSGTRVYEAEYAGG